ncbi:SHOCT domain-containing protein [Halosegnis marinus]|uniref:SHOCT domain-containing protein n=1 Tax=Halosegnis marinus TaxID=3034023 RepID=A0ABD5ZJU5_9EURY|nr:SHOCT domain-containing protein [Halosegnis sp. DT85]
MDRTNRRLSVVALAGLAVLVLVPVLGVGLFGSGGMMAGGTGGMMGGYMYDGGTGSLWWMAVLGVLSPLAFFAVLGAGGALVYRVVTDDGGEDPALAELRAAYARGDLSDEEFERRRERLEE